MKVLIISGSIATHSRIELLLENMEQELGTHRIPVARVTPRDFEPASLVQLQFADPRIVAFQQQVAEAEVIIVATPVYQASFSAGLKLLLDLIPERGLHGKVLLPLVTGGSSQHLLVADYAIKPVLSALGATHQLPSLYFHRQEFITDQQGLPIAEEKARNRWRKAVAELVSLRNARQRPDFRHLHIQPVQPERQAG